jgi:hypothetical protein
MAIILFEGTEFHIGAELTVGRVLGAACMRYGDAGDWYRFRLYDREGRTLEPSELVGERYLVLCDVRKTAAYRAQSYTHDHGFTAAGK